MVCDSSVSQRRRSRPLVGAVLLMVGVISLLHIAYVLTLHGGNDMEAYWNAAVRLREGAQLYPKFGNPEANEVYRYSAWFAAAWVPLTYLPRELVHVAWTVALLAASALSLRALWSKSPAAIALLMLFGSELVLISFGGNVHPLMLASLLWGVRRRSGPLWIAIAASLKAAPLLFVLVYVGRGEWRKALITLALTALLVAPTFAFDLSHYTTDPSYTWGLAHYGLSVWLAGAALAALGALWWARTRYGWLAGAIAVIAAFPRLLGYDVTLLLVGLRRAS